MHHLPPSSCTRCHLYRHFLMSPGRHLQLRHGPLQVGYDHHNSMILNSRPAATPSSPTTPLAATATPTRSTSTARMASALLHCWPHPSATRMPPARTVPVAPFSPSLAAPARPSTPVSPTAPAPATVGNDWFLPHETHHIIPKGTCVGHDLCVTRNITCEPLGQCYLAGSCYRGVCRCGRAEIRPYVGLFALATATR